MRALLIYPLFPKSFWSFEKTLNMSGFKAQLPPLGIITAAAIFPDSWEFKLVDRNVRDVTEEEWAWAEIVMLSAMIVQKNDLAEQIRESKRRGKPVVVGGPYPTSLPQDPLQAGADFLVLDEGEITIPLFLEALEQGAKSGTFRSDGIKPDISTAPVPRYDLLQLSDYAEMSVQFSRGCPFECEFCDIIILYGRKPRAKAPSQLLTELQFLYELGWRKSIFVVDDNFIGNKKNVKALLHELGPWLSSRDYPFTFGTEASVDLAEDEELMNMMVQCRFGTVFLGIETPDEESLKQTKKRQNVRSPLGQSVLKISRAGLRVMGGFIIGFDGEKSGAGERIVNFVEETAIPTAMLSMLQVLPGTALWHRLEREGRLLIGRGDINQTTLLNFIPSRPLEEITREYIDAFWKLYDPQALVDRIYRHYLILGEARHTRHTKGTRRKGTFTLSSSVAKVLLIICWRQGVVRKSRWRFWRNLWKLYNKYPAVVTSYLSVCAQAEHLIDYRRTVRHDIESALDCCIKDQSAKETAVLQAI